MKTLFDKILVHPCKSNDGRKIWLTEILEKVVNNMITDNFIEPVDGACKFKPNQKNIYIISRDQKFVEETQFYS